MPWKKVVNPFLLVSDEYVGRLFCGSAIVKFFGVKRADITKGDFGDSFRLFEGDVVVEGAVDHFSDLTFAEVNVCVVKCVVFVKVAIWF